MQPYWLTFTDGSKACCEGQNEYDAKRIAEKLTGKTVSGGTYKDIEAKVLPYPSTPIIWQMDHPVFPKCPPFCHSPNECAGKTSCPMNHSCCD